jgi:BASS family bile acid:Na+ symporter
MSEIMQFLEVIFEPLVFVFAVSNLFYMGLQVKMPEVIAALKNKKAIALIFVWSWVLGPALAYLITLVLPLAEPFETTLLLCSLAPAAKYVPLMVEKARGDMNFAGVLVPVAMVGTVVLMPLLTPLMVQGAAISAWSIAKPLLLTVFLPMVIGAAIRHYRELAATKILPAVIVIAKVTILVTGVCALVVYARPMLDTVGSRALLSVILFMVLAALISYLVGFGLKQSQRSVMSLGMLTRNSGPALIAALAIPNGDSHIITLIVLLNLGGLVLAPIAAGIFGKQAGKTVAGDTA